MRELKDNIDLKELEKYGFKYDEHLKRYILTENVNYNWGKIILMVGEDKVVNPSGTSTDYEKEIQFIEHLLK